MLVDRRIRSMASHLRTPCPKLTTMGQVSLNESIPRVRSGDSFMLQPTTLAVSSSAVMEYDFSATQNVTAKVLFECILTHAINPDLKLRNSVSIYNGPPSIVDIDTAGYNSSWAVNVLRAAAIGTTEDQPMARNRSLKLSPLDPGVIFDEVVIGLGGLPASQLGPPENHLCIVSYGQMNRITSQSGGG